jgi:hypothetical protein
VRALTTDSAEEANFTSFLPAPVQMERDQAHREAVFGPLVKDPRLNSFLLAKPGLQDSHKVITVETKLWLKLRGIT